MKSKAKFDPKLIQQFFIDHTEKLVLGLVGALLLYFLYESIMLKHYDKETGALSTATDRAREKIQSGPRAGKAVEVTQFPPYADEIDKFRNPVNSNAYPMPQGLYWKPFAPPRLRGAPQVFAVEELRAVPGRGAVAKSEDNASTIGRRWIVLAGLVPRQKQLAEYRAKFEGAAGSDPAKDVPKYAGYFVQRAEVVSGESPKWAKAKFFIFSSGNDMAAKWGGQLATEMAEQRFTQPSLTSPLPRLVDAAWGNEAVHPPQIPIAVRKEKPGEAPGPQPVPPGVGQNAGGGDAGGGLLGGPQAAKPGAETAAAKEEDAEYLLLRFFDFEVEPNKQYQYRVFLVLENPNHEPGLDPNTLEDPELRVSKWIGVIGGQPVKNAAGQLDWPTDPRYAKWSEPCPPTRVPIDIRLLGGSVAAADSRIKDINAEARLLLWQEKTGQNVNATLPGQTRGTVLNFSGATTRLPGGGNAARLDETRWPWILVDLFGGERLPDRADSHAATPGVILVMDEFGNLVIHDEVADAAEWEKATQPPAATAPKNGGHPPPAPKPGDTAKQPAELDDGGLSGAATDTIKRGPRAH